jgi:hypothetical protein
MEQEKICVNYMSEKGLICRIYKELLKTTKKQTIQLKKWAKDLVFSPKRYTNDTCV